MRRENSSMREPELLKRFISELKANLKEIEENLLPRISEDLEKLKVNRDSPYYYALVNSLGKNLHDFYDSIQILLFERIVGETGEGKPRDVKYHTVLLKNMTLEIEGIRPPAISRETYEDLEEYMRFRHLFRHTYGYRLEEERFIHLAERAENRF
ncbi:MAG: hypothetical protein ACE5KJ_05940 [Candidatus Zixiibacteriota bacterium]